MKVMIKGAGDLATGVAQCLFRAGMEVLLTEIPQPLAIRRTVALAQAVYDGRAEVEDLQGLLVADLDEAAAAIRARKLPVLVDEHLASLPAFQPDVLVEGTLAKQNTGITKTDAPLVVAMGPGFCAGTDAHVVVETMRGHHLGRLIYDGPALPDTGSPGLMYGFTDERLLKANGDGIFEPCQAIGDIVRIGDPIAFCGAPEPLRAQIGGCLRGLLQPGLPVYAGMKVGDIDPRPEPAHCYSISDKARALGGAVLTAILQWQAGRLP